MAELWFWICACALAAYAALDGFDLGAGALHLWVGRSDAERRQTLAAIGPYWDGNEVWLLAAGGTLFLAFPRVLGSGFSGLYLAIVIVIWFLILRGISIEFRSHVADLLWRRFWDVGFTVASCALPLLLGTALGNAVRGFPLDADGRFALPLFESFSPRGALGVLDTFTLAMGAFALLAVALHGANFLAWKTDGPVSERARAAAGALWILATVAWIGCAVYAWSLRPELFGALRERPLALAAFALALGGWLAAALARKRGRPLAAFLGSGAWIVGLLATVAACSFPVLLRSTSEHASLTTMNAAAGEHGLRAGAIWWLAGAPFAILYLAILMRLHRGKAVAARDGEGY